MHQILIESDNKICTLLKLEDLWLRTVSEMARSTDERGSKMWGIHVGRDWHDYERQRYQISDLDDWAQCLEEVYERLEKYRDAQNIDIQGIRP